jgi:hypothetical protein
MKPMRFFLALLLLPSWGGAALAHAIVISSSPRPEQTVSGEKLAIEIRFNSRIDVERSHLKLFKPDGGVAVLPVDRSSDDTLRGAAEGLAPGRYRLHWQTLSPDGHITQGDIPFAVSR